MKKKSVILIVLVGLIAFLLGSVIAVITYYKVNLSAVNKNSKETIEFTVSSGEATTTIIANLKKQNLIKNELVFKIYAKLNPGNPQAGKYNFSKSMTSSEIYEALINGKAHFDTVWVTFVEGKRLTYIAEQISKHFPYTVEEINTVLEDETYIKSLIDKYDVLTEDILHKDIYHPLEGYLFPDTYEFLASSSIKDIIEKMIATLDSKVSAYQKDIEKSNFSIHEIITFASLLEMEGTNSNNRPDIAGVFLNRIKTGDRLGSDVTTYYGANKDFSQDLYMSEINACNAYNTRSCRYGLPIGPISSVSAESIYAAINPTKHDYFFFVSDKYGKIYLTKTNSEHVAIVNELRRKGLWYVYE